MVKLLRLPGLLLLIVLVAGFAPPAQVLSEPIRLSIQAGFDGQFRENQWTPIRIQVSNDSSDVEGWLVVRPETNGDAFNNTYSVPVSLPQGARKSVFLYVTARSFASQVRVELVNNAGVVITAQSAGLRSIQPLDRLVVVFTEAAAGSVDLTGVHSSSYRAFQANWRIDNLPDHAVGLESVDMLVFSDVDTSSLSTLQQQALTDWVAQGGHLIVTGGANWQSTAAGLADLLPMTLDVSRTLDDLSPVADWGRSGRGRLDELTVIAAGTLRPEGTALVRGADDVPLIARRTLGMGAVDYLAFDPNARPLRGWDGLTSLWLNLAATVAPNPGWGYGLFGWDQAAAAANVMPGVNLLPDILPLCGFLGLYIALIGPLNYIVLSRLNRRELAWVTIPLFIVLFSVLAWVVGSNLRGNEVKISRLTVVQSWPDADRAKTQEVFGLLSPRRAQYNLAVLDGSFVRPVPRIGQTSLLTSSLQVSTDIQQVGEFRAADFPVDASFIATFTASTFISKPNIGGQATIFFNGPDGQQVMRGSVRNDSMFTLQAPVILARGTSYHLEEPLQPGEVASFEITLPGEGLPAPAPLAYAPGGFIPLSQRTPSRQVNIPTGVRDILGMQLPDPNVFRIGVGTDPEAQEVYRRRLFLTSFVADPYQLTTGRGNHVYLAGWTDRAPLAFELEGGVWSTLDTTLYLVQLETDVRQPTREVVIPAEQFTWMVTERVGMDDIAPVAMSLEPGDLVAFQFTPLPEMVLGEVNELIVTVDRFGSSTRVVPLQIWNWAVGEWEDIQITGSTGYAIRSPARYLGPQNAVQIRVIADNIGTFPRFQDISVEQRGRF